MSLPKSVQNAEAAIDQQIKAMQQGNTGEKPTPENAPASDAGTPEKPTPNADNTDWKHKYEVLQGKYNSQVPQLQEKVRQLEAAAPSTEELQTLRAQNEQLQQRLSQLEQAAEQQAQQQPQEIELDPYLVEEYGEEFAKAVAQQANRLVDGRVSQLEKRFNDQIQSTQTSVQDLTTKQKFNMIRSMLRDKGHDFDLVNNDPEFHEWLAQSVYGQRRQDMLQRAFFEQGDLEAAAKMYLDFIETQQTGSSSNPLNQHVDQARTFNSPDTGYQNPVFDPNAFQRLHEQFLRGHISQADFEKKEAELMAAISG